MAVTELGAQEIAAWVRHASELVSAHADELTELDAAIGDADHGTNMRRGMSAAVKTLDEGTAHSPADVLKQVAMTLVSKVGGASGPLYGTFFLRMSTSAKDLPSLDREALVAAVEAGIGGIVQRGRAQAGEKTMLDAWYPALTALKEATDLVGGARAAAQAAATGREATKPMLATKGRASYLGERSVGHIDPGAASTALIVQALADVLEAGQP